ncbi:rhodanese-like domain-containing protein [Arachidicoccus soli]|uniref:Rhodanese-like domain-containing protein n=1 Tax=Arachidicoccus soli TaxID=2341117 RepID=A0A386HLI3_9BACT|nr:rhodanese-like domain-containing protein [Arachidicoccus soli]AYD46757.1 rhodanese-like domain-containing protein [Arachidicoccus soli]
MNTISVEELKRKLDAGESVNLLDVREDYERAAFNIGGIHIPIGKIQLFETDPIKEWKEKEFVVYCRSGNRSGMAAMILQQAGYQNPINLTGGLLAWVEKYGEEI